MSEKSDSNQDGNTGQPTHQNLRTDFNQWQWIKVPVNYFGNRHRLKEAITRHTNIVSTDTKATIKSFYDSGGMGIELTFNDTHTLYGLFLIWNVREWDLGHWPEIIKFPERELHHAMGYNKAQTGNRGRIRRSLCTLASKKFPFLWSQERDGHPDTQGKSSQKNEPKTKVQFPDYDTLIRIPKANCDTLKTIAEDPKRYPTTNDVDFHNLEIQFNPRLFAWENSFRCVNPKICMEIKEHRAKRTTEKRVGIPSKFDIRFYDLLVNHFRANKSRVERNYKKIAQAPLLMSADYINRKDKEVRDKVTELYDFFIEMGHGNKIENMNEI